MSCCPQTEQNLPKLPAVYKRLTGLWFPAVTDANICVLLTCIQDTGEGATSVIDLEYCDEFLIAGVRWWFWIVPKLDICMGETKILLLP